MSSTYMYRPNNSIVYTGSPIHYPGSYRWDIDIRLFRENITNPRDIVSHNHLKDTLTPMYDKSMVTKLVLSEEGGRWIAPLEDGEGEYKKISSAFLDYIKNNIDHFIEIQIQPYSPLGQSILHEIYGAIVRNLNEFKNLTHLTLGGKIAAEHAKSLVDNLKTNTSLTTLSLFNNNAEDKDLEDMGNIVSASPKNVHFHLNVSYSTLVTDEGVKTLSALVMDNASHVAEINVNYCKEITDEGVLSLLSSCGVKKVVGAYHCNISPETYVFLHSHERAATPSYETDKAIRPINLKKFLELQERMGEHTTSIKFRAIGDNKNDEIDFDIAEMVLGETAVKDDVTVVPVLDHHTWRYSTCKYTARESWEGFAIVPCDDTLPASGDTNFPTNPAELTGNSSDQDFEVV